TLASSLFPLRYGRRRHPNAWVDDRTSRQGEPYVLERGLPGWPKYDPTAAPGFLGPLSGPTARATLGAALVRGLAYASGGATWLRLSLGQCQLSASQAATHRPRQGRYLDLCGRYPRCFSVGTEPSRRGRLGQAASCQPSTQGTDRAHLGSGGTLDV